MVPLAQFSELLQDDSTNAVGLADSETPMLRFNVLQGVDIDDPGQKSMDDCCEELFDHDYVKELENLSEFVQKASLYVGGFCVYSTLKRIRRGRCGLCFYAIQDPSKGELKLSEFLE
jgi:hypothetical protein